jgi:hypothetical protein
LLDRPDILLEDKAALRSLIYDKPHFPYLRRHEFASDIAPRTSRLVFNQLMGHSSRSNLQDVYVQALGNEGVRELEIAKGIRTREETMSPAQIELQPKYCWACGESNKHNAKFCFKCNVAISREGMLQDKEREAQAAKEAERAKKEFQELKMQQEHNSKQLQMVIENLSKLISKSDSLDFKDIKWPLLDVVDYYEDNRGPGMGVLAAKDILKRWREKDRGNTTKNTL